MRYIWSHFRFFVKKRESLYNSNSLFNSIYGLWNPDIILILLLHGAGSWLLQAQPDFCDILQYSAADGAALQHDHEPLQLFGCRFPPDVPAVFLSPFSSLSCCSFSFLLCFETILLSFLTLIFGLMYSM